MYLWKIIKENYFNNRPINFQGKFLKGKHSKHFKSRNFFINFFDGAISKRRIGNSIKFYQWSIIIRSRYVEPTFDFFLSIWFLSVDIRNFCAISASNFNIQLKITENPIFIEQSCCVYTIIFLTASLDFVYKTINSNSLYSVNKEDLWKFNDIRIKFFLFNSMVDDHWMRSKKKIWQTKKKSTIE